MASTVTFKRPTLNDLESSDRGPVWVVNTTKKPNRGQLVIGITDSGGKAKEVVIPLTWIAINLTGQCSRKQLLDSNQFRNSVTRGQVVLVSEEEAKHILSQSGAAEEQRMVDSFNINAVNPELRGMPKSDFEQMDNQAQHQQLQEGLSPQVDSFIKTLSENSEVAALNTLRNMGQLEKDEYRAIYDRCKELRFKEVSNYCKEAAGIKSSSSSKTSSSKSRR